MVGELPDDNEVCNACNGVPSPLLRVLLGAKGGEQTGQDHDDIGNDGDQDVATVEASKESQVEQEERSGKTPVNVTGPVDLTVNILGGVGNVAVALNNSGVVVADTDTSSL